MGKLLFISICQALCAFIRGISLVFIPEIQCCISSIMIARAGIWEQRMTKEWVMKAVYTLVFFIDGKILPWIWHDPSPSWLLFFSGLKTIKFKEIIHLPATFSTMEHHKTSERSSVYPSLANPFKIVGWCLRIQSKLSFLLCFNYSAAWVSQSTLQLAIIFHPIRESSESEIRWLVSLCTYQCQS